MKKTILNLILSSGCTLLVLCVVRILFHETLGTSGNILDNFFSSFGMIYAIIAGFLILTGLEKYNSLYELLLLELNSIQDLRDFLSFFGDKQSNVKKNIIRDLKTYIFSIVNKEWKAMADKNKDFDTDTSPELYNLILETKKLKVEDENEKIILPMLIQEISKITTIRSTRLAKAQTALPIRLKVLMGFMSIMLVLGLVLTLEESFILHILILLAQTLSIHLLFMVVLDLDNPFSGVYSLDKVDFLKLYEKLNKLDITDPPQTKKTNHENEASSVQTDT